jgi:hypothetical protein
VRRRGSGRARRSRPRGEGARRRPVAGADDELPARRPELLVDLRRVEGLDRIDVDDSGTLHIGAMVRQSAAAADPRVRAGWPVLVEAIGQIAHPQIPLARSKRDGDLDLGCVVPLTPDRMHTARRAETTQT